MISSRPRPVGKMGEMDRIRARLSEQRYAEFQDLLEDVSSVVCATTDSKTLCSLTGDLEHLHKLCRAHMAVEERERIFDLIAVLAPHRRTQAVALKREHRPLLAELEEIVAAFRTATQEEFDGGLAARLQRWVSAIHRHEGEEAALIQEFYETELGDGD